eukprot:TRINITY_DN14645_c0_g1_i2.p1 TRINITY_DN14645_c0_g1~~TRINITY_DN14645_c0_g1_i2.p1  ORF type:complete len:130 (-),score=26.21 TRINITY_DN14645_c0_g1_i2:125-514(-)
MCIRDRTQSTWGMLFGNRILRSNIVAAMNCRGFANPLSSDSEAEHSSVKKTKAVKGRRVHLDEYNFIPLSHHILLLEQSKGVLLSKAQKEIIDKILIEKKNRYVVCSLCLLYTSPSPRDLSTSRMPSSA